MMTTKKRKWEVTLSEKAKNTHNPIRAIVDAMKISPNPDKEMVAMSVGDPTVFGNLPLCQEMLDAVSNSLESGKFNGYGPAIGRPSARMAVADYVSQYGTPVTENDVILAIGCSHALKMCIEVLCNPGDNILLPVPGFSIYQTIALSQGIEVRYYNLQPDKKWEADLEHMESLIDDSTRAILVTNPSNPCGSVYSKEHLQKILAVAERHMVPIIADEIYEDMVFSGEAFHSLGALSTSVPVLSCSGLTKKFLVPGWRLGWIVIHDRNNALEEVRKGLISLTQIILGPSSIIEGALPDILSQVKSDYFKKTVQHVESNAKLVFEELSKIPGLKPIMPQGAMYCMFGLDLNILADIKNDVDFTEKLLSEESVFALPGKCFRYPNYVRLVLSPPTDHVRTAMSRIKEFCKNHSKTS